MNEIIGCNDQRMPLFYYFAEVLIAQCKVNGGLGIEGTNWNEVILIVLLKIPIFYECAELLGKLPQAKYLNYPYRKRGNKNSDESANFVHDKFQIVNAGRC
jgi:hypothetical protein